MAQMSKFSIIVPAYNTVGYVESCLDSIAKAVAYCGVSSEVICIDDGSKDGTAEVLDAYAKKRLPHNLLLKVIHSENGGVGRARNRGLDVATGNLIMFVDSDDLLRECALADIVSAASGNPNIDFVVFRDVKFNDGALPTWPHDAEIECKEENLASSVPAWLASVCVWGAAYRKEVVKKLRFRDCVLGEDLVFFCEVLARAKMCSMLGRAEYANRLRQGSASRSEETYRKIHDRILYHEFMFNAIAASGKGFGRTFTHGRGNSWIEDIPSLILSWPNQKERELLFLLWLKSMRKVAVMPFFSKWQRFVAGLVSATDSELAVRLLCVLPHKLKVSGFHR